MNETGFAFCVGDGGAGRFSSVAVFCVDSPEDADAVFEIATALYEQNRPDFSIGCGVYDFSESVYRFAKRVESGLGDMLVSIHYTGYECMRTDFSDYHEIFRFGDRTYKVLHWIEQ